MSKSEVKGPSSRGASKGVTLTKKDNYVPPPPSGVPKIVKPSNTKVKTYAVSSGKCPFGMAFPGIQTSDKVVEEDSGSTTGGTSSTKSKPIDDGFTPEERRKNELEDDPNFKKYITMQKMKIPLINIRNKIIAENAGYTTKDIDLFAGKEDIQIADSCTF